MFLKFPCTQLEKVNYKTFTVKEELNQKGIFCVYVTNLFGYLFKYQYLPMFVTFTKLD